MNDDGSMFLFFFCLFCICIVGACVITHNTILDTRGTVTKVINIDETTDIVVLKTDSKTEYLASPKGLMQEGQTYSDIDLDINYRIIGLEIKSGDE